MLHYELNFNNPNQTSLITFPMELTKRGSDDPIGSHGHIGVRVLFPLHRNFPCLTWPIPSAVL